jgi:hypothetical protein
MKRQSQTGKGDDSNSWRTTTYNIRKINSIRDKALLIKFLFLHTQCLLMTYSDFILA